MNKIKNNKLGIWLIIEVIIICYIALDATTRAYKYESAIHNYAICYEHNKDTDCSIYLQDVYTFEEEDEQDE